MRLVLLGAPGAGKGTQAALLKEREACVHVSTGDIFRKNLGDRTPLGLEAKKFMDQGALVPDDLVLKMVSSRLLEPDAAEGFLLDGFPRTVPQAEFLESFLTEHHAKLDAVLLFSIASPTGGPAAPAGGSSTSSRWAGPSARSAPPAAASSTRGTTTRRR